MPRTIWKGAISFGLVEIPVGLYTAETRDEVSFSLLDKRDLSPVGYKRYNKSTGADVEWKEIVKGYEYSPDRYVLMGDEDFKRANRDASRTVALVNFVDADEIDPWYYETPYYLEPLKRDSKGYALLREVLRRTNKVGIARVVLRSRQYLAAIVARGEVLVLNTLRYAHEVRDPKEIVVPPEDLQKLGVSPPEVRMAEQLVEGMSEGWDPAAFRDEYRDDLLALVEQKVNAGQAHVIAEPGKEDEPRRGEVVDLMPLLRKSLASVGATSGNEGAADPAEDEAGAAADRPAAAASSRSRRAAAGGKRPKARPAPKSASGGRGRRGADTG